MNDLKLRLFSLSVAFAFGMSAPAMAIDLPVRKAPAPATTDSVPHVQLGVTPVPEIMEELLRRVDALEGVEIRPTVVSLPGALGFWIVEEIALARADVIVGGREFAHLHPDGSLHASLSPSLAERAVRNGWAVPHPWANLRPGWEGFVMIYTPLAVDEMEVVVALVAAGYDFVTKGDPGSGSDDTPGAPLKPNVKKQDSSQTCSTC